MALRQCVIKGFNTKNSEGAQSSRRRCAKPASRHFVECGGWPPPFTAKCRVPTDRTPARDNDEIGRDDATRCCQNFGSLGRPQKAASRRTPRTTGAAQTWACTLRKATILVAQAFVTVCFFASVSDVRISCTRVRNRRAFAAGTSLIYRAGRASCRRPLNSE